MLTSDNFIGPHHIAANYGWFHVYAFTMFSGIAISVIVSGYKLHRHKIPSDSLVWSVIFIIPAALFGASFFGKNNPLQPIPFLKMFAFWHPGLSIHGGVLFGVIAGLIFFGFISRKTNISLLVYGDCIIPNILLGQVIGRWGNFFNHELLGEIVGTGTASYNGDPSTINAETISALKWLPAFIRDNCFALQGGLPETDGNLIVFRQPIFLYESMANLVLWLMITLSPSVVRMLNVKRKPWHRHPEKYQLLSWNSTTVKYSIFKPVKWLYQNHQLKRDFWVQAFYDYEPDKLTLKQIATEYKADLKSMSSIKAYAKRSHKYYQTFNPDSYWTIKAGTQIGLYFFGWNLIRFCLETLRSDPAELFIINNRPLDYAVLITILIMGLITAFICQFFTARFGRNLGWTYEKEYKI